MESARKGGAETLRGARRGAGRDVEGASRGRRGAGAQALACIRTQWTRASGRARARARDVRVDARIWTTWASAKIFFAHPPSEEYYTKNNLRARRQVDYPPMHERTGTLLDHANISFCRWALQLYGICASEEHDIRAVASLSSAISSVSSPTGRCWYAPPPPRRGPRRLPEPLPWL